MAKKSNKGNKKEDKEEKTTDKEKGSKEGKKSLLRNKKFIGILVVLAAIGFLLYQFKHLYLVALVNGSPITRLSVIEELENQYGQQAVESLITKELILQEARENNIQVNEEEIQNEIAEFQSAIEEEGSTLEAELAAGGQTRAGLEESLRIRQIVEKTLGEDIEVTDEEVREFYDQNQDLYGGASFEEVQDRLRDQMYQERLSGKYSSWIQQIREESRIIRFKEY